MAIEKNIEEYHDLNSLANIIYCPSLLQGMSHEMRTHMNAIVSLSFLISRNGCNKKEREEFSNQILVSCEQLVNLFDNFLDSAIIETGNTNTNIKICKLDNILEDLFSEFRLTLDKDIYKDLTLITDKSIDKANDVYIDSDRVFRVIRNLFQNALRNTESGYIKIGHYFRDNMLTFYVIDSGQGYFKCKEFLHTEDLNDSLTQYNDTISAINITLTKKLIAMLGGKVWIECNGLSGSGIYFTIPARSDDGSDINISKCVNTMISI
jgi:K+-sensing histidine kinase KdpD